MVPPKLNSTFEKGFQEPNFIEGREAKTPDEKKKKRTNRSRGGTRKIIKVKKHTRRKH